MSLVPPIETGDAITDRIAYALWELQRKDPPPWLALVEQHLEIALRLRAEEKERTGHTSR